MLVLPMGLYHDPELTALGITSHALEDYLIKLMLEDESVRPNVPKFSQLIGDLLSEIRGEPYNIPFNSSKELFQLVKPIIKHGFSDIGVVEALFENAKSELLRSVMAPVIERVEMAAAP